MAQYNRTYIKIMTDEETKNKLSHLAMKQQSNVSKFLQPFLRRIALAPELMEQEDRYIQLVNQCLAVLEDNTATLKAISDFLNPADETKAPDHQDDPE